MPRRLSPRLRAATNDHAAGIRGRSASLLRPRSARKSAVRTSQWLRCVETGFPVYRERIATAVQHNIRSVTIVFNDGGYGNVRRMQQDLYGGRVIASDLRNPDFVRFAESFGAAARRAEGPRGLSEALRWALDQPVPVVIEAPVDKMPKSGTFSSPRRKLPIWRTHQGHKSAMRLSVSLVTPNLHRTPRMTASPLAMTTRLAGGVPEAPLVRAVTDTKLCPARDRPRLRPRSENSALGRRLCAQ